MIDVASYKTEGFYVGRECLPLGILEEVVDDFNALFSQQLTRFKLPLSEQPVLYDALYGNMKTLFDHDLECYLATLRLCSKTRSVMAMYLSSHIYEACQQLGIELPVLQTVPVVHLMAMDLVVPGGYHGVGVHQDWHAIQSSLNNITIWIPFTDVGPDNFTLEVIPGSHMLGLCDGEEQAHIHEIYPKYYDFDDFVPVEAKAGDVLFMSNFTIHRSGQQGTPGRLRLSTSFRYEDGADPTFVEREYPFTNKRTVDRTIITPGFPDQSLIQKVYEV